MSFSFLPRFMRGRVFLRGKRTGGDSYGCLRDRKNKICPLAIILENWQRLEMTGDNCRKLAAAGDDRIGGTL